MSTHLHFKCTPLFLMVFVGLSACKETDTSKSRAVPLLTNLPPVVDTAKQLRFTRDLRYIL
ncbi:MAG: hypothetical protein AAF598_07470, partial [Bacteroidota bacterium]